MQWWLCSWVHSLCSSASRTWCNVPQSWPSWQQSEILHKCASTHHPFHTAERSKNGTREKQYTKRWAVLLKMDGRDSWFNALKKALLNCWIFNGRWVCHPIARCSTRRVIKVNIKTQTDVHISIPARASCGAWHPLHWPHGKSGAQWEECRTQGLKGKGAGITQTHIFKYLPKQSATFFSSPKNHKGPAHYVLMSKCNTEKQLTTEIEYSRCSYRQQWALRPAQWGSCWLMLQLRDGETHTLSFKLSTSGSSLSEHSSTLSNWSVEACWGCRWTNGSRPGVYVTQVYFLGHFPWPSCSINPKSLPLA